jgi:hypothetical protein
MNLDEIAQSLAEEIAHANLAMLREQNAELLRRAKEMQAFIRTVPGLLISARLDESQGKPTTFDYGKTKKLLAPL